MIKGYAAANGRLQAIDDIVAHLGKIVWLDLLSPTEAEEAIIERDLAVDLPTRAEMEEIELSSRLYYYNDAVYMTVLLPAHADADDVEMAPVTFVLTGERLITVRYHDPRPFRTFPQRAEKAGVGGSTSHAIMMALLEAIIERLADILERAAREIDGISREIFQRPTAEKSKAQNFQSVLEQVGGKGHLLSDIRDSLMTLERLFGFLGQVIPPRGGDPVIRTRLKSVIRDARSLTDHASFLSQKITFLLDATLGLINIEQNAIIKIFSIAAVAFLPPTLIASVYGMNFQHMPELRWLFGYPFALALIVASGVLPLWFFKRRGWL